MPMDRLLCGDVGYGKTEVALRAVMKCILDGKQAAILVPTTVLAQQHYATACGRFQDFPVKIEVLSRFTHRQGAEAAFWRRPQTASVDLLIGTHKLLQKNVEFKDLGLLVIDEEQRFGVTHKERLKEMSRQVDVLTLSATPIPRTLNMALSGLRDMSTIEEPPADRQPVQTYVLEHDWAILEDAMRRELEPGRPGLLPPQPGGDHRPAPPPASRSCWGRRSRRGGGPRQDERAGAVRRHAGAWWTGRRTCWCAPPSSRRASTSPTSTPSSSRTPTGWAWPSSTRSGAGSAAAPAGPTPTSPTAGARCCTETAAKRLAAIREYVEFGSGFKIAMRDLEIRGAGNLLGPEQSGYLMSVGYDLYLKLLEEAVLEERGEEKQIETECAADLTVNANIPERYVPSPEQRMDLYRRIAAIRTNDDASDLMDEMIDRYGEPPEAGAGSAGRGAAARCRRQGRGVRHHPEEGRAALHLGGVPSGGAGAGVRIDKVQIPPDPLCRGDAYADAEAEARRRCSGNGIGAGGGSEAGNTGAGESVKFCFAGWCGCPKEISNKKELSDLT